MRPTLSGMAQDTPIEVAVKKVGSQRRLAEKIGVDRQLVSYWISKGRVPLWRIPAVAKASGLPQSFFHEDAA